MRKIQIAPVLAALALGFSSQPAVAATPTSVNGLTVTKTAAGVQVTGTVAFGGEDPVLVGDDATNDNLGGATTAALGNDLDGMFISQPDAGTGTLQFVFDLNGMTSDGIPEHFAYNWDIRVDGGSGQDGSDWSIKTWRTRVATTTNTDPYAALFTCVPSATGGSSCTPGPRLPVTYDSSKSEIRLSVTLADLGANPGSEITAWNRISAPVWVGATFGTQTLSGQYDTSTHEPYVVPTKTVKVGIAPAGSPINYTTPASLAANSSFSGLLSSVGPGTYDVGAQACFATNCDTSTATVTIT